MNANNMHPQPPATQRWRDGRVIWTFADGGRGSAGYKGQVGDCVTRAIAIATEQPYQAVYDTLNTLARRERVGVRKTRISSARLGVYRDTAHKYLLSLGWTWTPTMKIGQGCQVHLRPEELPAGRLVVNLSKHFSAVIDGVIYDLYDSSRDGTRCVYGYWHDPRTLPTNSGGLR